MSDAAASIASSAARYLGRLAIDEAKYLHRVKYKVVELRDELRWMQVFLEYADTNLQKHDKLVDLWISQINDFSYEAEDTVDKYLYGVSPKRKDGILNTVKWFCFTCCNIKDAKTLHQVGSEIDALTQKISKLTSRLQTYMIKTISEGRSSSSLTIKSTADPFPLFQDPFVGEGKDIKEWVKILAYGGRVILSGPTGTGKTSLALAAYSDKDVATHYNRRVWVVVSRPFDRNKILYELFFALRPEYKDVVVRSGLPPYDRVRSSLADIFKYDRCFVVLDDVTTAEDWSFLEGCFPTDPADNLNNSNLLVTTPDRQIADLAGNKLPELGPLSNKDGRCLFREKACLGKHSITDKDQKMGLLEDMLRKCRGWPSLIVQLGGILSTLEDVEDWHTVNEGITAETSKSITEMTYRFLPNQLKPFFLYLGMFPAKFKLLAKELYRWWAVEGMITARDGRSADNLAESYMYELVNRGMVQVVRVNVETRRIEMVMLHHSMREVCLEEARKDNFLKVVSSDDTRAYSHDDGSSGRDHDPSWSYSTTIRRLAVHMDEELQKYYVEHADIMFYKAPYLRSFLLFSTYSGEFLFVKRWIQLMSHNYPSLRVLSLNGAIGNITLPKEIGNFIHLRVLSLKGCDFGHAYQLTPTISNLRSLQTLDLRTSSLMIIPNVFLHLKQLIHLCFPMKHVAPRFQKFQLDGLIHLETLKHLDLRQCKEQVFQKLKELRRISIIPLSLSTKELPKLKSLLAIQTIQAGGLNKPLNLSVSGDVFSRGANTLSGCKSLDGLLIEGMTLSAKVQSLKSLAYLSSLRLIETGLYEDPMPVLGMLPKLKVLVLSYAYSGQDMVCSSTNGFPKLTHLGFGLLKNLQRWIVNEGALPNLDRLWIFKCDELTTILGNFPNLTRLILEELPILKEGTVVESMPKHTHVIKIVCHVEMRPGDSQTVKFLPSPPCEDDEDDESCVGGNHEERETSIN